MNSPFGGGSKKVFLHWDVLEKQLAEVISTKVSGTSAVNVGAMLLSKVI